MSTQFVDSSQHGSSSTPSWLPELLSWAALMFHLISVIRVARDVTASLLMPPPPPPPAPESPGQGPPGVGGNTEDDHGIKRTRDGSPQGLYQLISPRAINPRVLSCSSQISGFSRGSTMSR